MNKSASIHRPLWPVFLTLGLALGACQTAQETRLNDGLVQVTGDTPNVWQSPSDAAIPADWSTLFQDDMLRGYLAAAKASNLDLQQAEARLRQSEASVRQSRALLGPSLSADLSASGAANVSDLGNSSDSGSSGLSASWDPDLFGVNRATIRQAEAQLAVTRANTERLRRSILAQTARAYFQIIEADQQLQLAQENLTFIEETKRVSEARFNAGDIARSDLALAELEFENALAGLRNQEFATRAARRALSILVGDFGDDDLDVATTLPAPSQLGTLAVPAALLETRYDVLASRAALDVELANFDGVRKDNWPALRLSGRVGSSGAELSDLFDPDFYVASLTASISTVLFDSGRNAARVDLAEARIDAALAAYAQAVRGAVFDVNNAFDSAATLTEALAALERARASAEEALALEQIKFDLGETILLDVLTVQRRVNAIRGSRINTERRLLDAQVEAYLALGSTTPN